MTGQERLKVPDAAAGDDFEIAAGALLASLAAHDIATRRHSGSVGAWSRRIATQLGLAEAHVVFIERCAVLHDIGKTLTPPEILTKPGALSADEWLRMRAHAAEGADMLAAIPVLRPYAAVVRAHHERPDGRGYPQGLAAEHIPFEARIVSVADSFDAMIGRRTYGVARTPAEAIDELRRCRGTQFDPEVVDCLVKLVAVPQRIRTHRLWAVS